MKTVYLVMYYDCVDHPNIYGIFGNEAAAQHANLINDKTEYYSVMSKMSLLTEVDPEKFPLAEKNDGTAEKN